MISTSLQHERFMLMNGMVRWNPFREMDDLQRRMSSLFDWSPFRRSSLTSDEENITVPEWAPLVDIDEDDKEYLIKVELHEVQKDDVKVTVESGTLTISGERKAELPVMLIYGDSDMFRPEHEVKFYQLLGGGLKDAGWQREHMSQNRLAILPNLTHYEMGLAPQLVDTALPFLNGQGRAKSWNEQVSAK